MNALDLFKKDMWIARDKDGQLYAYDKRPIRQELYGFFIAGVANGKIIEIFSGFYQEITWLNSPVKVNDI